MSNRQHIRTSYSARVHYNGGTANVGTFNTMAEAKAAAETERALQQGWIDDDLLPELIESARQRAADNGDDPDVAASEVEVDDATVEIRCELYRVGDDDITDDPVAQAIVEAIIDTPFVRWPKSRDGDRAGKPVRLLFADHPTRDHWTPIELGDSELMLQWFTAHGLEYPESARKARKHARWLESQRVRTERQLQYEQNGQGPLSKAREAVARLESELAAARQVLAAAEKAEQCARIRRDENLRYHAEALARRIPV